MPRQCGQNITRWQSRLDVGHTKIARRVAGSVLSLTRALSRTNEFLWGGETRVQTRVLHWCVFWKACGHCHHRHEPGCHHPHFPHTSPRPPPNTSPHPLPHPPTHPPTTPPPPPGCSRNNTNIYINHLNININNYKYIHTWMETRLYIFCRSRKRSHVLVVRYFCKPPQQAITARKPCICVYVYYMCIYIYININVNKEINISIQTNK